MNIVMQELFDRFQKLPMMEKIEFLELLKLFHDNPEFRAAYDAATPPGHETPPGATVHGLLTAWKAGAL